MIREEMLNLAKETVTKHRQSQYGTPEDNFTRIAQMWSTYLGVEIKPHDVANMMILLKVVRSQNKPDHHDSWLDMAGYAACGCEIATGGAGPKEKTPWHFIMPNSLGKIMCGDDTPNSQCTSVVLNVTCKQCKMLMESWDQFTTEKRQLEALKEIEKHTAEIVNSRVVLSDPDIPKPTATLDGKPIRRCGNYPPFGSRVNQCVLLEGHEDACVWSGNKTQPFSQCDHRIKPYGAPETRCILRMGHQGEHMAEVEESKL
jgi:hypothetical protein